MHKGGVLCHSESINFKITHQDEQELRDQIATRLPALNGRLWAGDRTASQRRTSTSSLVFIRIIRR